MNASNLLHRAVTLLWDNKKRKHSLSLRNLYFEWRIKINIRQK